MTLVDEKYVALTTFKRDGTPKPIPVWIVSMGPGKVAFTTASSSWKVKRIHNNNKVCLQPCNNRGVVKAGTVEVTGTAEVLTGAQFEEVRAIVKAKYGMQFRMIVLVGKMAKLRRKGSGIDCAVLISVAG